jgi:hypothetical protein
MNASAQVGMRQLPLYQSHKKVWALKIAAIESVEQPCICSSRTFLRPDCPDHGIDDSVEGAEMTPAEKGYAPFRVSREFVLKHKPKVGGYFVQYSDGYKSFSPAQAFEEGYTRI